MGDCMATKQAYVQVKDLKKHYGDGDARLTVLDGIDTSINRGEICVMLGPSGSGKSTFLNLIGGLEDADGGSIMVDGCDLTTLKPADLGEYRRRELGFVFQFYNLVPDLTIKENIEVTAHLSKNPLNVDDLLRSLGLYEHRNKFPRQVSGGQQQRCAIGRALVKNPGLLLCDEPTGALDYKTSKEILQLMEDVNRTYGCTIVIVTHNAAIARMANRVLRLRDGRIVEDELNPEPVAAAELDWEAAPCHLSQNDSRASCAAISVSTWASFCLCAEASPSRRAFCSPRIPSAALSTTCVMRTRSRTAA